MDAQQLLEHLALAEEHVAIGAKNVARQREAIAELERRGHDTTIAWAMLAQFEQLQAIHVADRDRLLRKVEHSDPPPLTWLLETSYETARGEAVISAFNDGCRSIPSVVISVNTTSAS